MTIAKIVLLAGGVLLAAALGHGGLYVVTPHTGGGAVLAQRFTGRSWFLAGATATEIRWPAPARAAPQRAEPAADPRACPEGGDLLACLDLVTRDPDYRALSDPARRLVLQAILDHRKP